MALVSVLWGIALLSIVAVSFLSAGNISYRLTRNGVELSQLDAVAEAAVARAVLGLLDARIETRWRGDGVPQALQLGDTHIRISVQDELGKIDLNFADGGLLIALFKSAGLDAQAASGLVDKVLDWRDSNASKRLDSAKAVGAKAVDYRLAGHAYRPRNGPFQSVDELKLVAGMRPDLFRRAEPALTVYSGRPFFDQRVAPREALLALPAMDASKVESIIANRSIGQRSAEPPGQLTGRAFSVRTEIKRSSGVSVREAVVRVTDDPARPYWILSWKNGRSSNPSPLAEM